METVYELIMNNGDTEYKNIRVSLHKSKKGAKKKKEELKKEWLDNGDFYTAGELKIYEIVLSEWF